MAGMPLAAVAAAAGADMTAVAATAARAAAAGAGPGLELPVGGGEDCRTLGKKICPPRVFTMAGLEKEKRWKRGEERRFQK